MPTNHELYMFLERLDLGEIKFYKQVYPYIESGCYSYIQIHPLAISEPGDDFMLEISPGDTILQCKYLYGKDREGMIRKLRELGWNLATKFHFSFMNQNIIWTGYKGTVEEYARFWRSEYLAGSIRQYKRHEWPGMLESLVRSGNMDSASVKEFKDRIESKKYTTIKTCAGLELRYPLRMNEIMADESENLEKIRRLFDATKRILC